MSGVTIGQRTLSNLTDIVRFLNDKARKDGITFEGTLTVESREYDPIYLRDRVVGRSTCAIDFEDGEHFAAPLEWIE